MNRLITGVAVSAALLGSAPSFATSVAIVNGSFETPIGPPFGPLVPNSNQYDFSLSAPPGWTNLGLGGAMATFAPTYGTLTSEYSSASLPDGFQVVALSNSTAPAGISQALGATLQADSVYTLSAYVGQRRLGGFAGYLMELLAGTTVIATSSSATPPAAQFVQETATYVSSASDPLIGQQLSIRLSSSINGGQTNFDAVTLDVAAVPEPSTWALLIAGLVGFGSVMRRRGTK